MKLGRGKIVGIAFTAYLVTDVRRARLFYEGVLGLNKNRGFIQRGGEDHWIEYDVGSGCLAIISHRDGRLQPGSAGVAAVLEVDDFDAVVYRLRANGIDFVMEPRETPVHWIAVVSDPDGNRLAIHKQKRQSSAVHDLSSVAIEDGFSALPTPPKECGQLCFIVSRGEGGTRACPDQSYIAPETGLIGDAWSRSLRTNLNTQLAVMRYDIAQLFANGRPLTIFGDNLFLNFDISAENLPSGSRFRVGEAIVEVTPTGHNGCRKFSARVGKAALNFVQTEKMRPLRPRGVYCRVVEAGEVRVGDLVHRLTRPNN